VAQLLWIALGGALGASARYLLVGVVQSFSGSLFPLGTLVVNALGSFLLGYFYEAALRSAVTPELRAFFAVGVLGAFTTFSTFSYETLGLLREGATLPALLYGLGSPVLGVGAALVGVWLGGR